MLGAINPIRDDPQAGHYIDGQAAALPLLIKSRTEGIRISKHRRFQPIKRRRIMFYNIRIKYKDRNFDENLANFNNQNSASLTIKVVLLHIFIYSFKFLTLNVMLVMIFLN